MARLDDHPTVVDVRRRQAAALPPSPVPLDAEELRRLCIEAGADDAGVVGLDREEVADQREGILALLPGATTLLSFVCRMNRENIRTPARSVANLEFHHAGDHVDEVARRVVATLEARGVRAMNGGAMGFPMEMQRFPERMWVVAHKPVAVAAGLGRMGIHRNVIHPRFGNFILLGTVVIAAPVDGESRPIDYNPCLECKLCVAACPTGAIGADGHFDFTACYTHNYREFMGGFTDWVEQIAESGGRRGYRERVTPGESASMWQSLSFGANYKAAYCMSVCPAGSDVIGPFLNERPRYLDEVVRPLQDRGETVYVTAGSDAEAHVARRFPHKTTRRVGNGLGPTSIAALVAGMPIAFQRGRSEGLAAVYHFTFTGDERREVTVEIRDRTLTVSEGHTGVPDLRVTADSRTWLRMIAGDTHVVWALLRRRIRMRGNPRLLLAFSRCFPS